jgi:pimeloyl-ACP methyl ester carboxylesterase
MQIRVKRRVAKEVLARGGRRIFVCRFVPPVPTVGRVLVPPLIGGSGLQQFGYFKPLGEQGFEIVSFDYCGHGRSSGSFSIAASLADTRAVLARLAAERDAPPLFGSGDCYGALTLLAAAGAHPGALRAVALFNPVPSLHHVARPREVLRDAFRAGLRNPLDLRRMLATTNERLFPEIDKSDEHFGILRFERLAFLRSVLQYLFLDPLARTRLPELPALCVYGRGDGLLRLGRPEDERAFRRLIARVLPAAAFQALDEVDHYWTGVQALASELAAAFFRVHGASPRAQREPGERASIRNHQPIGLTTSSGFMRFSERHGAVRTSVGVAPGAARPSSSATSHSR